jgi:hypothetical protein
MSIERAAHTLYIIIKAVARPFPLNTRELLLACISADYNNNRDITNSDRDYKIYRLLL